jgi:hypothetical protein
MTTDEQERLLAEARDVFATDPARALLLRMEVADSGHISPAWSHALVDIASQEHGQANFEAAANAAGKVLAAPSASVDSGARAVAGVLFSSAREALDQAVDESLLAASIEAAAEAGHPYYAGIGLTQLGRLLTVRGERAASKAAFERAVVFFDSTESALAGPGALLRLATLEKEDGEHDQAREHIAGAFARLDKFPLAGRSAHRLREKLSKLRDSLA